MKKPSAQEKPLPTQGYRIWNFRAIGRGRRLGFRHLWSSLGRRDAFVRRKLGRRGSNAIALTAGASVLQNNALCALQHSAVCLLCVVLPDGCVWRFVWEKSLRAS